MTLPSTQPSQQPTDLTAKLDRVRRPRASKVPPATDVLAQQEIESYARSGEKHQRDLGWIGGIIGCSEQAPFNIAFVVIVTIVLAIAVPSFYPSVDIEKSLTRLIPILTLALGYVFGNKQAHKQDK